MHVIAPIEVVVEPAAQGVQDVAPVEDEKVLNVQSSQETPLADDLPAGHTAQVAECAGAKVLLPFISGHLVQTMFVLSLLYVLAGHGSHCPVE